MYIIKLSSLPTTILLTFKSCINIFIVLLIFRYMQLYFFLFSHIGYTHDPNFNTVNWLSGLDIQSDRMSLNKSCEHKFDLGLNCWLPHVAERTVDLWTRFYLTI